MVGQKGIFFTFMAFLLVGTLIVLNTSIDQAETGQETNLAEEAALNEVKNTYNNIEQQISGLGEIHATRRTPFTNFESGPDWFILEGQIPLQDVAFSEDLGEALDALDLLKVFSEGKTTHDLHVKVDTVTQSSGWGTGSWTGGEAEITYLLLDPCLRITGRSVIEAGVEKTTLTVEAANEPECGGNLYNCADVTEVDIDTTGPLPIGESTPFISGSPGAFCGYSYNGDQIVGECYKTLDITSAGTIVNIEFGRTVGTPDCNPDASYRISMQFGDSLGEFNLESLISEESELDLFSDFNYSVKKTGFDFCAGTGENVCLAECQAQGECDDLDACTTDSCDVMAGICEFEPMTECIDLDGCCPAGCTDATDCDPEPHCTDEVDNDSDGDTDCDDTDCSGDPACVGGCTDGQTQACPNQTGVCAGAQETCTGGAWPGCDTATYTAHNANYEDTTELTCSGGEDNDCDGDTDCGDVADCAADPACTGCASSGSGTALDPYIITTIEELEDISLAPNAYYELCQNLDASDSLNPSWRANGGAGFTPITNFAGNFDGKGFSIDLLFINRPGTQNVGLFGQTLGGEIKNVGLSNANITGLDIVGGLVGDNASTISYTYIDGQVTAIGNNLYMGGLIGNNVAPISNSYSTTTVNAGSSDDAGGFMGRNHYGGVVTDSYSTGNVMQGNYNVGGFVGKTYDTVSDCYSTGPVSSSGFQLGGFAGQGRNGTISRSYSTGAVFAGAPTEDAGGFVGNNDVAVITNSYSSSSVTSGLADDVGGFAGSNENGSIDKSYSWGNVNGVGANVGGFVGRNEATAVCTDSYWDTDTSGPASSACGNGRTTAQMWTEANYIDWDFTNIWDIVENVDYPFIP